MNIKHPLSDGNTLNHNHDERIRLYIEMTRRLSQGDYSYEIPASPTDDVGKLGKALLNLSDVLQFRYEEVRKLDQITSQINAGLMLGDILESIYRDFREVIPYNRIGFSLIESGDILCAHWAKTDRDTVHLDRGYSSSLKGSSLQRIIDTGMPRIINDLEAYYAAHPDSESTRLILKEGYRSSLTCPLIASGVPIGFIFFSSVEKGTYREEHVDLFRRIAGQLSVIVEKGRLVSELAEQKAAIERQNEALRQLNDLKNALLGMAAHDLRNPIASIQMAANLLLSECTELPPEVQNQFLTDISRQTNYMLSLLDDLLDVSQIEAGKLDLQLEAVSVDDFMQEEIDRQNKLAAQKETQVSLALDDSGMVWADPNRLRQVVDNLISNAVKYSPAGSHIIVRARLIPGYWQISVEDEGPGIKSEERKYLFEFFSRLSAQPTGGEKSTGLGLAITRRMVEAHGGTIGVDSQPGEGSTFWFTLPLTAE